MKKQKSNKLIMVLVTFLMFISFNSSGIANASLNTVNNNTVEDSRFYIDQEMNEYEAAAVLYGFLNTPDSLLIFLFDEISTDEICEYDDHLDPRARSIYNRAVYRVGSSTAGTTRADTGTILGNAVNGTPGMTLSITRTNTLSHTVTTSFGATDGMISSALGFSVTASNSFTETASIAVPSASGGRLVSSMTLRAHPYVQTISFRVYRAIDPRATFNFHGNGSVTRQVGIAFRNTFTFQ